MSSFFLSVVLVDAVKATALLLAAAAVCGLARRGSAAFRHQIWALALAGIFVLPALRMVLPVWPAPAFAPAGRLWRAAFSPKMVSLGAEGSAMVVKAVQQGTSRPSLGSILAAIWVLVAALLLLRAARGAVGLWLSARQARPVWDARLLRTLAECAEGMGLRRRVRLTMSSSASVMPCTWGMLRPVILLPAGSSQWSQERLHMVITHELAHIRRWDWPVRLMAEAACAAFWFHPLVWRAASQVHQESERACDDAVLCAGEDAARYAAELLDLVRGNTECPAAVLAVARPSNFERRFTSMLNPHVNRRRLTRTTALWSTSAACLGLFFMAALRAPAEANEPFAGTVIDTHGAAVVNATVTMTDLATHITRMTATSSTGAYQLIGLPAGAYELRVQRAGFGDFALPQTVAAGRTSPEPAVLVFDDGHGAGPKSASTERTIRVGSNVAAASLIRKVQPVYPVEAKQAGIQGSVQLAAVIDATGTPVELRVTNVDVAPELARSAVETVSQWRYKPTLLNGEPVRVMTAISVSYTLVE